MIDYWNRTFASQVPLARHRFSDAAMATRVFSAGSESQSGATFQSASPFPISTVPPSSVASQFPISTVPPSFVASQFSTVISQQPPSFATSQSTSVQRDSSKFSKQGASL